MLDKFQHLYDIVKKLRAPDGCPWDREHTAAEFAADAGEEAAELIEAFGGGNNADIEEEWGDVLFVLLATAAAAEDEGRFTLRDAIEKAHDKMIRRHEHVFGDTKASSPDDAINRWNQVKARERNEK